MKAAMKAVLIRVPEDGDAGVHSVFTVYDSMGLGYVAASLRRAGHTVEIVDCMAGPRVPWLVWKVEIADRILATEPDLVGFSLISSMNYGHVAEFVGYLREQGLTAVMVAGGEQATLYAGGVLTRIPGLDVCVTGEGEQSIVELVAVLGERSEWHKVAGLVFRDIFGIQNTPRRPLIADLDSLPWPDRDTLPAILAKGGEAVMAKSRGCWGRCTFCSIKEFYGDKKLGPAWRTRSAANVVGEIKHLYQTYGADRFWFVDDEFFAIGNPGRLEAEEFFQLLIDERLPIRFDFFCRAGDLAHYGPKGTLDLAQQAGLRRVFCGIESGSKAALKLFNKGSNPEINRAAVAETERCGIDLLCEFILFNPWSTLDQVAESIDFLKTVPRGTGDAVGKYDPITLSSAVYIHRETPLGRNFTANWPQLRDQNADTGDDDFVIPYRFLCPRVQVLHDVVTSTLQRYAPLEGVFDQLLRLTDRLWLPEWSNRVDVDEVREQFARCTEALDGIRSLRNDEALRFFQEVFEFVSDYSLEEGDEALHEFRESADVLARRQAVEADNIVEYLYSVTVAVLQEVWDLAVKYNFLGSRIEPPFCIERR